MVPFSFHNQEMQLVAGAPGKASALYWPREQALLVADLHLEKGSYYARTGQMLPPYDSRETLERLAADKGAKLHSRKLRSFDEPPFR